jgi:hypothetical protein
LATVEKERDDALVKVNTTFKAKKKALKAKKKAKTELTREKEARAAELTKLKEKHAGVVRDKDATIKRLTKELNDTKTTVESKKGRSGS